MKAVMTVIRKAKTKEKQKLNYEIKHDELSWCYLATRRNNVPK